MVESKVGGKSKRQYERGAEQMVAACVRRGGAIWDGATAAGKIERFLDYLRSDDPLRPGTVAMYRQCARVVIERILAVEGDDPVALAQAVYAARAILDARIGNPDPPRGASRKVNNPLLVELGDVFSHQRAKFIRKRDHLDLVLALYIIVMPRIGLRPVELTWARWDGNRLYARTAKRRGRPEREVPHEHWPPVYKSALGLLVALMPRELDDDAFEAWRNVLASRLARASRWTRTKRRLSLYFARHIAIANWKQLGITPELIAMLAGHAGLHSQHHYASGRAGYGARYVFLNAAEGQALLGTEPHPGAGETAAIDVADKNIGEQPVSSQPRDAIPMAAQGEDMHYTIKQDYEFDVDDMPRPKVKNQQKNKDEGKLRWEEYRRRHDAEWARHRGNASHGRHQQSDQDRQTPGGEDQDEVVSPRNDDADVTRKLVREGDDQSGPHRP